MVRNFWTYGQFWFKTGKQYTLRDFAKGQKICQTFGLTRLKFLPDQRKNCQTKKMELHVYKKQNYT